MIRWEKEEQIQRAFLFLQGELDGFGVLPSLKGAYDIYNYKFARQQALTKKFSLYGSIRGQFTDGLVSGSGQEDYLDSAENFSLGGLYGVHILLEKEQVRKVR